MRSTIHVPNEAWSGNEVAKRTFMHRLAFSLSEPGDWHMVMDGDQVVTTVPPNLDDRLVTSPWDVGEVTFTEDGYADYARRILFRAVPLRIETNHFTYITDTERVLWGAGQEQALSLSDVVVDHRPKVRSKERLRARGEYYETRDHEGVEKGPLPTVTMCVRCLVSPSEAHLPTEWRTHHKFGYVGDWVHVCLSCSHSVIKANRGRLSALGLDPDLVVVTSHQGLAVAVPGNARGFSDRFREWLETDP